MRSPRRKSTKERHGGFPALWKNCYTCLTVGAERPIFDKFVEIMRPKDAAILTTTKTGVMFR